MNDYLGAHMSIAGGLHLAIDRAVAAGCGVCRSSPQLEPVEGQGGQRGRCGAVPEKVRRLRPSRGRFPRHLPDQPGGAPGEGRTRAWPPSGTNWRPAPGSESPRWSCTRFGPCRRACDRPWRVIEAFDHLFGEATRFEGKVLLETTAGQGTNLGRTFEELQTIINGSKFRRNSASASTRATPLPRATIPPRRQATPIPWSSSTASSAWKSFNVSISTTRKRGSAPAWTGTNTSARGPWG